jgi:3-methyladenine DNA glycosylase AlkD
LIKAFDQGSKAQKSRIFRMYLRNTKYINNWDLVDASAERIVGTYLMDTPRTILYELARSKSLWERRIAVLSTFHFIKQGEFSDTFKLARILLKDEHDLIHKAVGWMLREIGKRDLNAEQTFLKKHCKEMPRTMLRYAIERFPETVRLRYLSGTIG